MIRRREVEMFSMSFLDTITCAFGAIILLLVLTKSAEPMIVQQNTEELEARTEQLQQLAEKAADQARGLDAALAASRSRLAAAEAELSGLRVSTNMLQKKTTETRQRSEVAETIESRLATAKQSLTEEMRRLYASAASRKSEAPVGGIPVDSEYIIFVIDTSGSMLNYAWNSVRQKLRETLDVYPKVKGLQVMSDMGEYMYPQYSGKWIPDTPGRRKAVLDRLRSWQPFSNSSPVEGIETALRTFAAPDKKISIYVFGDDFTGGSINAVLKAVRRLNPKDAHGNRRVRIHTVGFPTQFDNRGMVTVTGMRFATLMRLLAEENGGAFVGLQSSR